MSITATYIRVVDTQPTFNFMVNQSDFYINTHGLSVTDSTKSASPNTNNFVYVMNQQQNPVYVSGVSISSIVFRQSKVQLSSILNLSITPTTVTYDDNYEYHNYNVYYRGNLIGILVLNIDLNYKNGSNTVLYPFQSYRIGAQYTVQNVNNLNVQYFGASKLTPDATNGIIDINCSLNVFTDSTMTTLSTTNLVLSLNLIKT